MSQITIKLYSSVNGYLRDEIVHTDSDEANNLINAGLAIEYITTNEEIAAPVTPVAPNPAVVQTIEPSVEPPTEEKPAKAKTRKPPKVSE